MGVEPTMSDPPIPVLLNPSSGSGRARRLKEKLEAELRRQGIPFVLKVTESEDDLRASVRLLAADNRIIAAAGGDSTFLIMAEEILKSGARPALGLIGMGSSNDIPAALGLDSLETACRTLRDGRPRRIDAGAIEREGERLGIFLGQANIGLGAVVNRYVAGLASRRPRLASRQTIAGFLGVREAYRKRQIPIRLYIDGGAAGRVEGLFAAAVFANMPVWATGLRVAPEARPDDGRLDLCLVEACPFRRLFRIYSLARQGRHLNRPEVRILRSEKFEVRFEGPGLVQTDGEILNVGEGPGSQAIAIRPLRAALEIIAPPGGKLLNSERTPG
jgi:diacylglycerol kinase (ATP)